MDRLGGAKGLLWIGVAGLLLTCVVAVWFGPHSAARIQAKVQAAADAALVRTGGTAIRAVASGQSIKLVGVAGDDVAIRQAADRVLAAIGPGGLVQGGVTKVRHDEVAVAPFARPFVWTARKETGRIALGGAIPSAAAGKAIAEAAQRLFKDAQIANEMKLAAGAPAGVEDWTAAAQLGLEAIQPLVQGQARLADDTLTITGIAPTESAVAEANARIAKSGPGVIAISQISGPAEWSASLLNGRVTLSGRAPTTTAKRGIAAAASAGFKGAMTDETTVGIAGAFAPRAIAAMPQFSQFKSGELSVRGRRFLITGEAPESVLTYLKEDMKKVVDVYDVQYDVRTLAPALPELANVKLDAGAPNLRADCQTAFERVMASNKILFANGAATITRQSGEALDKVAEIARRCSGFRLEVQGYTDNRGRKSANVKLSQDRAEAVRTWLQEKGVPADRLSAKGFGSDNPITSNARESGRARNRRIEFKVSG